MNFIHITRINKNVIKFSEFIIKNKEKNKNNEYTEVVTVSNKYGFIKQSEYFNEKTIIASEDKTNYLIIRHKAFGFNPSRINVGSIGYYNKLEPVLFSPIYVSFYVNNKFYIDEIIYYFMKSSLFQKQLKKFESGSVRKGIKFNDLVEFSIPVINDEKQKLIIENFNYLNELIFKLKTKISLLESRKKHYLKALFI